MQETNRLWAREIPEVLRAASNMSSSRVRVGLVGYGLLGQCIPLFFPTQQLFLVFLVISDFMLAGTLLAKS
jgi:hypothetical protein